jgi:hypothetical protein
MGQVEDEANRCSPARAEKDKPPEQRAAPQGIKNKMNESPILRKGGNHKMPKRHRNRLLCLLRFLWFLRACEVEEEEEDSIPQASEVHRTAKAF